MRCSFKASALTFGLLFVASASFAAESLTLDQCIAQALSSHPSLLSQSGTIEANRAQASLTAVGARTKLTASENYTRSGATKGVYSGSNDGEWETRVSVSQLVYDFGRTHADVKSAKLNTQASEETLQRTRETVISDVREAYYGLNKSVRDVAVQKESVDNYQKRLEWAKSYYSVGTKAKIEVTKAETDLANAQLDLIKAESSTEQYKAQLASAMGTPTLEIDSVVDELDFVEWEISLKDALERALAKRADLTAEDLLVEKAKMDLRSAKLTNAPEVSASGSFSWGGEDYYDEDSWSAGLSLSIPIGDGGEAKATVAKARANLTIAEAGREELLQEIILDVRKAWQSLRESAASIVAARVAEKQARENLDLALGRYRAGVGDSLEISDAVDEYSTAQTTLISCLYDHKAARLSLEKAMGEVYGL